MISGYRLERRRYQRVRLTLSVVYRIEGPGFVRELLGGREYEAETLDISEGGMAIKADHYLPLNTRFLGRLIIVDLARAGHVRLYNPLALMGQVRSVAGLGKGQFRLGVEFEAISHNNAEKLRDIIFSQLHNEEPADSRCALQHH